MNNPQIFTQFFYPQMDTLSRSLPQLFLLFALDIPSSADVLSAFLLSTADLKTGTADLKTGKPSANADHIVLFRKILMDINLRRIGPGELEVLKHSVCIKPG